MRKLCTLLNSRLNEPVMGASCWLWSSVVVAVGRPASSRTALSHPGRRHSVHHRFSFLHCLWPCFGEENDMSVILFTFFQEKQDTWFLIITSANKDWFSKFGHCQISKEILYVHVTRFPLHLSVFLHYLEKLENSICANFSGIFACETSEFILPDMWPSRSES